MSNPSQKPEATPEKLPQAGPHNTPANSRPEATPGSGVLPKPGEADDDDMAPTG